MNTKQTEALKLAQEALKELRMLGMNMQWHDSWLAKSETAITAIREALAEQPAQQEPEKDWGAVAEKHLAALKQSSKAITEEAAVNAVHKMAQARGLIDIGRIFTPEKEQPYPDNFIDALKYDVARRDSEALAEQPAKEKAPQSANCEAPGWINSDHTRRDDCNTEQPAQQQEPVAVARVDDLERGGRVRALAMNLSLDAPLYTTPPQRKPLTDEEIWDEVKAADLDWQTGWSLDEDASNRYITFARAIEAAHGIIGEQK